MKVTIITIRLYKLLILSLITIISVGACSRESGLDTDLVQLEAHLEIANVYLEQGQFRSAIIEIQNALQIDPNNVEALTTLSRINLGIGAADQAISTLESILNLLPGNLEATLLLGEAYLNSNEFDQVISLIDGVEFEDREQQNQASWLLGSAYTMTDNFIIAEQQFQSILDSDPGHINALIGFSRLSYVNSDLDAARSYLDQAINIDENDLDLWIWRGVYSTLNGQYPEAEQAFFEALEIMGRYDTITAKRYSVLQAILVPLQMQQKNEEALRYSQIIAESPQGQLLNSYAGAVEFYQNGDFASAEQALRTTLATAPDHPDSNILLGMTNYAQGNYSAAAASLTSFVDMVSSSQPIKILAATQLQLGNATEAVRILQEAEARFPEDGSITAMIGLSQQASGNYLDSIQTLNRAIDLAPESAEIHFSLASSYYFIGDIDRAIQELELSISIDPDFELAKTNLINLYLRSGQVETAENLTDVWLAEDSDSYFNNNIAGVVSLSAEDFQQAREYFNKNLAQEPEDIRSKLLLAQVSIAELDFNQAEIDYQELLSRDPTNVATLAAFLELGSLQGEATEKVDRVREIISQYPGSEMPPLVLSQFLVSQGNLTQALEFAELAASRSDNSRIQNNLVDVLIRIAQQAIIEDTASATAAVERAIALQDSNLRVLIIAAQVANQDNNFDLALTYINRIKSLQPDSELGYELEGDLLAINNELADASDAYRQAWQYANTASIGNKLYLALNRSNQSEEAQVFLESWILSAPDDATANLLLAMAYQQTNQESQAIEHYEVAHSGSPQNLIVLNNLAWLYQDSSPDRALQLANQAASLYPENPDVLDTYGWILFKQDRTTEALEVLRKAQELAPESDLISEHLKAVSESQ